jgi:D-threonate/D-erythronate kinase
MEQPIFILADDLTGSADAAAYFRNERRRVRVTFTWEAPWDLALGTDIVQVLDTESRDLAPAEARRRVERAVSPLAVARSSPLRFFKKVDSTLRGNPGVEIETVLRALGRALAVLAPAFPANGRTVRGGRIFVRGIPAAETRFGQDPRRIVRVDRAADAVGETSDLPVHEVGLDAVRAGPARLAGTLAGLGSGGIAVCDAETDEELETVAMAMGSSGSVLPCGSGGLARAVARVWDGDAPRPTQAGYRSVAECFSRPPCRDVLVAVGSANRVAHEQLAVLRQATGLPVVALRPSRLVDSVSRDVEVARAREEAMRSPNRILAIAISPQRTQGAREAALRFEGDLARVGLAWVERRRSSGAEALGLVCTGGATALALCAVLEARAIWPEGEVSPGVPWSSIEGSRSALLLVTKAGGFGGPTALADAVRFLTEEPAPAPQG